MSCCNSRSLRQGAVCALLVLLALAAFNLIMTGCASTQAESNIPWNTPQSWEGAPYLPGLSQ